MVGVEGSTAAGSSTAATHGSTDPRPDELGSSGTQSADGSSGTTGELAGTTGPPSTKFDVGAPPGGPPPGCSKIDFLFVIDNSESMLDEQAALAASFQGFVEAITTALVLDDFHVMVVDTDGSMRSGCADGLGVGRVSAGDGADCGVGGGLRYLTSAQDDLVGTFECIAAVGAGGHPVERAMGAMQEAITTHAQLGGCNEGFLRDDAILVITVISDEGDFATPGPPAQWRATVVDAKGGQSLAVVPLGIISDLGEPGSPCSVLGGASTSAPFMEMFFDSFTHGRRHSVCDPPYDGFFLDAVASVQQSCESFEPPG